MTQSFTFSYSLSTRPYDRNKDAKNTSKLTWEEKQGTVRDLADAIKKGFAFCATFNHQGSTFAMSAKKQANLKSTNFIVFDLDAVRFTAGEFYGKTIATELTPSIIYTTANDGHFKEGKDETYCNRYRVIYVVDEPLSNQADYEEVHQALKRDIANYIGDDNIFNDNSDKDVAHFFAGCADTEMYCSNKIVSLSMLVDKYNVVLSGTNAVGYNDNGSRIQCNDNLFSNDKATAYSTEICKDNFVDSEKVKSDNCVDIKKERKYYTTQMSKMSLFAEFKNEYISTHKNYNRLQFEYISVLPLLPEETTVEFDEGKLYKEVDENHIRILRKRHKVVKQDKNGNDIETWENVKYKDGQRRREKLYLYLQMVKAITPSATSDQLLWQAVNFIIEQVDNTKAPITKNEVIKIVDNVMGKQWTPSAKSKKKYGKRVCTNKELAREMGIKMRYAGLAAVHEWRSDKKIEKWEMISQYYDPLKTDKCNTKIMQDAGIEITVRNLRQWKKENGLTNKRKQSKNEQISLYYDPSMTDGQNIEQLAANGVKVSLKTLQRWKKENGLSRQNNKHAEKPNKAAESVLIEDIEELTKDKDTRQQGANMGFWGDVDVVALAEDFLRGKPLDKDDNIADDETVFYYDDGSEVTIPW